MSRRWSMRRPRPPAPPSPANWPAPAVEPRRPRAWKREKPHDLGLRSWGSAYPALGRAGVWLLGRAARVRSRPAPLLEHRGLEGAELGHSCEAGEVAAVGQLGVTAPADQPAMLWPVKTAVEEMVERGIGCRPAAV